MIDSSFTDLCFFFFFKLSNLLHCHFTLGFNVAQRRRWQFCCCFDPDTTSLCLARRKMLSSQGLLAEEMQVVTFVPSPGKINLVYGTGSLPWELQGGWSAVQHYPLVISLVTTLSKPQVFQIDHFTWKIPSLSTNPTIKQPVSSVETEQHYLIHTHTLCFYWIPLFLRL